VVGRASFRVWWAFSEAPQYLGLIYVSFDKR